MAEITTTLDGILNHQVMLEQPALGYRVAIDTILLAAAVPACGGDRILDLGCGVGGVMVCLAHRVPGITGLGIEIQPELVHLCRRNIERNICAVGLTVEQADVTNLKQDHRNNFDHVMMNPPYHPEDKHDVSPSTMRRVANTEKTGDLLQWINSSAKALKPFGTLTLIHRADRCDEILTYLQSAFGHIEIMPILPKEGAVAKRMIIRARKDELFASREVKPLVLHHSNGAFTDEANAIFRDNIALAWPR